MGCMQHDAVVIEPSDLVPITFIETRQPREQCSSTGRQRGGKCIAPLISEPKLLLPNVIDHVCAELWIKP